MTTELSTDLQSAIDKISKKSTALKWVAGLAGVVFIGFTVWAILYIALGVAALGLTLAVTGIAGAAFIHWWPTYMDRLRTRKIERIIEDARKSPIPTLWDEHDKDGIEINGFASAIEDYATEIGNCQSKARSLSKDLQPQDLEQFENDIALMQEDLLLQEHDLAELRADHKKQEVEIKRAAAIWDLNMAVSKANAKNLSARREETISRIRKETALDSVTSSMNRSKAQLRTRINSRRQMGTGASSTLAISSNPSDVIDVASVTTKERTAR